MAELTNVTCAISRIH